MYPCFLTPEQVKLFKEDKPYNSPFKGMNWRDFESDNGYHLHGGMQTSSFEKIFDSVQDYRNSRSWN